MRDPIEHTIIDDHHAEVRSDSGIAVYQELGTATIPPRSFLMQAAVHKEREVVKIARELWTAALFPHALNAAMFKITYEALKELAHETREDFADLTNPGSNER